jgi:hypothetical protein
MMHPYVIDTSVIYNITGDRSRKTKLALLAQRFLGEEIQQGTQGHCSVEDSSTCMKLTQLKLANGIYMVISCSCASCGNHSVMYLSDHSILDLIQAVLVLFLCVMHSHATSVTSRYVVVF